MSQMEVRFLAALSIRSIGKIKSGDIKQSFKQSKLPSDKTYVVKSLTGCPRTLEGSYWFLKCALHSLRRVPQHWFDKMTKVLQSIGLHPSPNNPCIFSGFLTPGEH